MTDEKLLSKIVLGTAQFDRHYGITNKKGKINQKKIDDFLFFLKKNRINHIDTASKYGNAEYKLGKRNLNKFKIITKLPPLLASQKKINKWVNDKFNNSLSKLCCKKIYSLLLHKPNDLLGNRGDDLYNALNSLKKKRLVSKIGISIYDFEEAIKIISRYKIDIIQVPFNVLDQRLLKYLNFFKKKKIEIHARSIFLQGLLLDKKTFRSKKFQSWKKIWDNWEYFSSTKKINYIDLAINFAIFQKKIDYFVFGFENLAQLKEVINYIKSKSKYKRKQISYLINNKKFACLDEELINPSNW